MSFGLTHSGAIARGLGYVPAQPSRPAAKADEAANVSAVKPVRPADSAAKAREQIREQVLAERGYDLLQLYRMGAQERIRVETEVTVETALRQSRARLRQTATFIDLRV